MSDKPGYLVHWPVTKLISHSFYLMDVRAVLPSLLVTIPVASAASIGLSWVFHLLVERRFLNPPSRAIPPSQTVAEIMACKA